MNYIVLVKQVPDVKHIPDEAWDWEKGTLKRGLLDNVCNDLDKQALAFAVGMREKLGGTIVALTMGPPFADAVLRYALSLGADAGVLLTDRKLGGADTPATAYPLAQAVRKIEKELFAGDTDYLIISGMQSVDGDTAQVPPQVAEELGIAHIAYATSFKANDNGLEIGRITRRGMQTVVPTKYPCMLTVADWTLPLNATFSRTRWARTQALHRWSADDVEADEVRIGHSGSRTTVFRVFAPRQANQRTCRFESDPKKLVGMVKDAFEQKLSTAEQQDDTPHYQLPEGKAPSYQGEVWVFAEQEGGEVHPATFELLGKARELADELGENVGAVLVGSGIKSKAAELVAYGADSIYLVDNGLLEEFLPLRYTAAISSLVAKYKPQMMLFSATPMGRELAPRIAYRSDSGLTADCTSLDIFDLQKGAREQVAILRQTRPALGGNIMASIIAQHSNVQMSTVRPGVMRAMVPDSTRIGRIVTEPLDIVEDAGVRIVSSEIRPPVSELKDAVIIVAGGGGCRTKEGFAQCIPVLAEGFEAFFGQPAMVGASRVAVEAGFADRSHQVGQTGQTVKPKLYIAVGISGAVQHVSGMQNSDLIIAINKDSQAPIFNTADFGIVGSLEEIGPAMIEALRKASS